MTPADTEILFRVAQWYMDNQHQRKHVETIRQIAQTEENYLVIIREIERVNTHIQRARSFGTQATLTLVEWLRTLEDFHWRCAYCQAKPFQVLSHFIRLPFGGTTPENCVPACYGCSRQRKQEHVRIQAYLANRKCSREQAEEDHS